MAEPSDLQRAVRLESPELRWSVGAPTPVVVATEQITRVAFLDNDVASEDLPAQAIGFTDCLSFRFGFPNDEALAGHPLFDAGLDGYGAYKVLASAWLEELRSIEASHEQAPEVPFERHRHYVLVFHDSTLEAIATDILPMGRYQSLPDALTSFATEAARWTDATRIASSSD